MKRSILFSLVALTLVAGTSLANPTARVHPGMVFDEQIGRVILFGGVTGFDSSTLQYALDDTWAWTGLRWVRLYPEHSPERRSTFPMVYDSNRDRMVIFGGIDLTKEAGSTGDKLYNDTWIFEDGDWEKLNTPTAPPARRLAAAAFDPLRDRVVLFGGSSIDGSFFDTWEFDGTTWKLANPDGPKIGTPLLVYDKARKSVGLMGLNEKNETEMYRWNPPNWDKITTPNFPKCTNFGRLAYQEHNQTVLFVGGGCGNGTVVDETWVWNGLDWTDTKAVPSAGATTGHAMAYDTARGHAIAFGGFDFAGERSLTARFVNNGWRLVLDHKTPGARSIFVFEHDKERKVIWLFGGHDDRNEYPDLWQYAAGRWTRVKAVDEPSCLYPVGTFDSDRKKLVMFCDDETVYEWDGTVWTKFDPKTRPSGRRFASMVYDERLKKSILFGGYDGQYLRDAWLWDGAAWTKVDKKDGPKPRGLASLFYDRVTSRTIVFGGIGRPNNDAQVVRYGDMFSFDGAAWTEMMPAEKPGARYGAQVEFDPVSNKIVMYGGKSDAELYLSEQWNWDGTKWEKLALTATPGPRMNGDMAYDPSLQKLTLFGGYAGRYFADLWSFEGNRWQLVREPSRSGRRLSRADSSSGTLLTIPIGSSDAGRD